MVGSPFSHVCDMHVNLVVLPWIPAASFQTSNTGLEPLSGLVLGSSLARRATWGEILQEAHLQGGGISNAFFRAIQAKLVHKDLACVHRKAPRNKAQTASYPPTSRHLLGLILI